MRLVEWLKVQGVTQEELGRKVGLTQARISQIVNGGTSDARTALAISAATGNAVTLQELLMAPRPMRAAPSPSPEAA